MKYGDGLKKTNILETKLILNNMAKDTSIRIADWEQGVAKSRYKGFEYMSCVDTSEQGVLKINVKTKADAFSTAAGSLIKWFDQGRTSTGSTGKLFAYGGASYFLDIVAAPIEWDVITASQIGNGEGMVTWSGSNLNKAYMIVGDDTDLHGFDCSTTASPVWDYDFTTGLQDVVWHPMIVAQNNRVYIGNGRYVGEIYENSGQVFDPGNSTTFTIDEERLDLPSDYITRCLEELGDKLIIGTYDDIKSNSADIFVWDKSSDSFDRTLRINNVDGINQLITFKNLTYVQAGVKGEWFVTNGSSVEKLGELPQPSTDKLNLTFNPGAVAVLNDKIYFGIGNANSDYAGVWSIDVNTGKTKREYVGSVTMDTDDTLTIGAVRATTGDQIIFSWEHYDASASTSYYGIDRTDTGFALYSNSEAEIITAFYRVGNSNNKRTFKGSYLQLAKPLVAGESVTVYKRTARNADWGAAYMTMTSGISKYGGSISSVENIQFKIVLDTGSSTTGPEVLEFIVD